MENYSRFQKLRGGSGNPFLGVFNFDGLTDHQKQQAELFIDMLGSTRSGSEMLEYLSGYQFTITLDPITPSNGSSAQYQDSPNSLLLGNLFGDNLDLFDIRNFTYILGHEVFHGFSDAVQVSTSRVRSEVDAFLRTALISRDMERANGSVDSRSSQELLINPSC